MSHEENPNWLCPHRRALNSSLVVLMKSCRNKPKPKLLNSFAVDNIHEKPTPCYADLMLLLMMLKEMLTMINEIQNQLAVIDR